MDGWDIVLLVIAGYLAVVSLIRLMNRHRNHLAEELLLEAEAEKNRKQPKV